MRKPLIVALGVIVILSAVFGVNYLGAIQKVSYHLENFNELLGQIPGIPNDIARRVYPTEPLKVGSLGVYNDGEKDIDISQYILDNFLPSWLGYNDWSYFAKVSPKLFEMDVISYRVWSTKVGADVVDNYKVLLSSKNCIYLRITFYKHLEEKDISFTKDIYFVPYFDNELNKNRMLIVCPDLAFQDCKIGFYYGLSEDALNYRNDINNLFKGYEIKPGFLKSFKMINFIQSDTDVITNFNDIYGVYINRSPIDKLEPLNS